MKPCFALAVIIATAVIVAGCATTDAPPRPDWAGSPRTAYPYAQYLAQEGISAQKEEARTAAANALAQYLRTEVSSVTTTSAEYETVTANGQTATTARQTTTRDITLSVDVTLRAVEYTDPWYDKRTKMWHCVAFCERTSAFAMLRPEVDAAKERFDAIYTQAENEGDPFSQIRFYHAAAASGMDFEAMLNFASLISKEEVDMLYSADRQRIGSIASKVKAIQVRIPLFITVDADMNGSVFSAVTDSFNTMGYTVTVDAESAAYTVSVHVDLSRKELSASLSMLTPSATLTVQGAAGAVYTFGTTGENATGRDEGLLRARACQQLGQAIRADLPKDFTAYLDGK